MPFFYYKTAIHTARNTATHRKIITSHEQRFCCFVFRVLDTVVRFFNSSNKTEKVGVVIISSIVVVVVIFFFAQNRLLFIPMKSVLNLKCRVRVTEKERIDGHLMKY